MFSRRRGNSVVVRGQTAKSPVVCSIRAALRKQGARQPVRLVDQALSWNGTRADVRADPAMPSLVRSTRVPARIASRILNFWILPVTVCGKAVDEADVFRHFVKCQAAAAEVADFLLASPFGRS